MKKKMKLKVNKKNNIQKKAKKIGFWDDENIEAGCITIWKIMRWPLLGLAIILLTKIMEWAVRSIITGDTINVIKQIGSGFGFGILFIITLGLVIFTIITLLSGVGYITRHVKKEQIK